MKKSIIIAILFASTLSVKAQGIAAGMAANSAALNATTVVYHHKVVCYVQSGKERQELTAKDVKYVLSKRNSLHPVFASGIKTISNNETADVILAILKARK